MSKSRALAIALTIALAACSGKDGAVGKDGVDGADGSNGVNGVNGVNGINGAQGPAGPQLAKAESCEVCHKDAAAENHQNIYNQFKNSPTAGLSLAITNVSSSLNADNVTYTSTVTFTCTNGGVACDLSNGGAAFDQKRFRTARYDAATNTWGHLGSDGKEDGNFDYDLATITAAGGTTFTIKNVKAPYAPESVDAQVYSFLAVGKLSTEGIQLYSKVANAAKAYGAAANYTSTVNVAGCEACHGKPFLKEGYRAAAKDITGLNDMAACRTCHRNTATGGHLDWQIYADKPATYVAGLVAGKYTPTPDDKAKYSYNASLMNDVHMSHAMDLAYPQSMANCVQCHAGKLDKILTDDNFKLATCKSCHPVTGDAKYAEAGRAPSLKSLIQTGELATIHTMDLYTFTGNCNLCHSSASGGIAPVFSKIHTGYNKQIYAANGTKYATSISANVDSATFDKATNKATVKFSVAGADASAIIQPHVVVSLYGYDSKDFIVSGHNSQSDGTYNLEFYEGAAQRSDATKSANSARLQIDPPTASAGVKAWTATVDLSLWASKIADGSVKRFEIGVLPKIGVDQTKAPTGTNLLIAVTGKTATVDLAAGALADYATGKAIVKVDNCNKCHDRLATTFHTPDYGSAGTVGCRLCHFVGAPAAHFEMQSRSIDGFVHAIHSFQKMDLPTVDFSDAVQKYRVLEHTEPHYPNFTLTNCESCHNPNTYGVPDQSKSLVSMVSASANSATWSTYWTERDIGTVSGYVMGPAARACGSCHRAAAINEEDAAGLASIYSHTGSFSTMLPIDSKTQQSVFDDTLGKIMAQFR